MANKFADALKPVSRESVRAFRAPTSHGRDGLKHIGGYFDPAVSMQLKQLALQEQSSVQHLLGEAIDLLFQKRGLPAIARGE